MVSESVVLVGLFTLANAGFLTASGLIVGYSQRPRSTILHTRAVYALGGSLGAYTIATLLGTVYWFALSGAPLLNLAAWTVGLFGATLFLVSTVLLARDFIHFRRRSTQFGGSRGGGFERAED
jgi:hypothetical protein